MCKLTIVTHSYNEERKEKSVYPLDENRKCQKKKVGESEVAMKNASHINDS